MLSCSTAHLLYSLASKRRLAFSLAEVMIAIGILGIGMLMVAATFPVGLDQSRIVSEKLQLVGLRGIEEKMPAELSGGMKKRVGIARAIAIETQIP